MILSSLKLAIASTDHRSELREAIKGVSDLENDLLLWKTTDPTSFLTIEAPPLLFELATHDDAILHFTQPWRGLTHTGEIMFRVTEEDNLS